jgi:hypothetical protein
MEIEVEDNGRIVFEPTGAAWDVRPENVTIYRAEKFGGNDGYYALSENHDFGAWNIEGDPILGPNDEVTENRGLYIINIRDFDKIAHVLNWRDVDRQNKPLTQFAD